MTTKPTPASSRPPQAGPHSSRAHVETTYEIEVMFPHSTQWQKTQTLTTFTDPQTAWDYWTSIAATDDMWCGAQARLAQIDRRILPGVAEPADGWDAYHHRVGLLALDAPGSETKVGS